MEKEDNIVVQPSSSADSIFLNSILDAYANFLDKKKEELDLSKFMLNNGAKTELAIGFENMAKDPIGEMFTLTSKIEDLTKEILNKIVKGFFASKSELIETAFKTETSTNDLHYCIVLKEDSPAKRIELYSFLSNYELFEYAIRFPIYFQIVPKDLQVNIPIKEEIIQYAGVHQ